MSHSVLTRSMKQTNYSGASNIKLCVVKLQHSILIWISWMNLRSSPNTFNISV